MDTRNFLLERMEHFLRGRLEEEALQNNNRFHPSLTISRQCGTGMDRLGPGLVEYLDSVDETAERGWALFDRSLIDKVIGDNRLPESLEPYFVENTKFPIVDALEQMLNLHPSEWSLFHYSANTIRKLCRVGNVIVVGRGGNFVTADLQNTFHVRLVGTEEKRVVYTRDRFKISVEEARKRVNEADKGRTQLVKRYTGMDIGDPLCYHLTVNVDNLSEAVLVRIIADNLLEWASEKERELETRTAS